METNICEFRRSLIPLRMGGYSEPYINKIIQKVEIIELKKINDIVISSLGLKSSGCPCTFCSISASNIATTSPPT